MAFKFRPVDSTFYDLFTESAGHLVTGAGLLAEMFTTDDTARATSPMRPAGAWLLPSLSRGTVRVNGSSSWW